MYLFILFIFYLPLAWSDGTLTIEEVCSSAPPTYRLQIGASFSPSAHTAAMKLLLILLKSSWEHIAMEFGLTDERQDSTWVFSWPQRWHECCQSLRWAGLKPWLALYDTAPPRWPLLHGLPRLLLIRDDFKLFGCNRYELIWVHGSLKSIERRLV